MREPEVEVRNLGTRRNGEMVRLIRSPGIHPESFRFVLMVGNVLKLEVLYVHETLAPSLGVELERFGKQTFL